MTPRPSSRVRKILRLVARYKRLLGLDLWTIEVKFTPDKRDKAGCSADDEYMSAELFFDLAEIAPEEDETYVRHEMLHIPTWELLRVADFLAGKDKTAQELVRAARERVTTLLERAPLWERLARGDRGS